MALEGYMVDRWRQSATLDLEDSVLTSSSRAAGVNTRRVEKTSLMFANIRFNMLGASSAQLMGSDIHFGKALHASSVVHIVLHALCLHT